MKISRRSWHFRQCRSAFGEGYEPKNLCRHFWMTVTALWLALLTGILLPLILLAASYDWLVKVGGWLTDRLSVFDAPKPAKEPGLLRSYLAARKRRICPMIEVVD